MEVAGAGIAVASLAIQLVDSVDKLRRFIEAIKDAPSNIADV